MSFNRRCNSVRNIVSAFKRTGNIVTTRFKGWGFDTRCVYLQNFERKAEWTNLLQLFVSRLSFSLEKRQACTGDAKLSRRRMLSSIQSNLEIRFVKIPLVKFTCRMSRLSDMFSAVRFKLPCISNYVSIIKRTTNIYPLEEKGRGVHKRQWEQGDANGLLWKAVQHKHKSTERSYCTIVAMYCIIAIDTSRQGKVCRGWL